MIQYYPMQRARNQRVPILASIVAAILAIMILAGSLSQLQMAPGRLLKPSTANADENRATANAPASQAEDVVISILKYLVLILLPISVIYVIISPTARKRLVRDVIIIASVLLMIFLFANAFQGRNGGSNQLSQAQPDQSLEPPAENREPGDFVTNPPQWLTFLVSFVVIALLVAVAFWLASRWRAQRPLAADTKNTLDTLVKEAQTTLDNLRAGASLKDAVIRCYHEMCLILRKERGLQRQRAMTPREFESYLSNAGVRNEHVRRLTRLFESARYGQYSNDIGMAQEAELCLSAIVTSYASPIKKIAP